ncbi:hypothetical protein [Goodfellowiella coeruleoviolacea]|uniref:Uncharacterized protein n=1 Tax=Goodfellowiella coeruleoviolacea TaxID=334858 RepID=A0AAE3KGS4_9PSEU|nr:hypothetical protein [Goodfellowiella coeruleoviolacea]MCP2166520.1 hypothetical protein [Goodfellowiella coeruleoviolacea]
MPDENIGGWLSWREKRRSAAGRVIALGLAPRTVPDPGRLGWAALW